jgi:hypothetical protein
MCRTVEHYNKKYMLGCGRNRPNKIALSLDKVRVVAEGGVPPLTTRKSRQGAGQKKGGGDGGGRRRQVSHH